MPDYQAKITEKESQKSELTTRQDEDYDLFRLVPFEMKGENDEKWPNMRNVTLPAPWSFGSRVISVLHKSERQTVVEGDKLDEKDAAEIEDFINIALTSADDGLAKKQIVKTTPFLNTTAALRGWVGARTLVRKNDKGEIIFDILPWDTRSAVWEPGPNGLQWAAYKQKRSPAAIYEEYGKEVSKETEVTDVLDKEANYVYVGSETVREQEHGLGYVPVMIQPVTLVPLLALRGDTSDTPIKYYGESMYAGSRDIFKSMNELATIFQTMSIEAYRPALQKETSDLHEDVQVPEGAGTVQTVYQGELYREMPKRDLYQVQLHAWTLLNAEYQRATLPYIEFGELAFELSAVAIAKLGEGRELIFAPIILALGAGYKQIAWMLIDQFKKKGMEGEIGRMGKKIKFSPKQLEGDYDIRFDFHAISPEQNIANYSVAQAAKALNILPDDVILEEILKRSNPASDKSKMADQTLRGKVPSLDLYLEARRLIEEKRYVEARIVAAQIGMSWEEIAGAQTRAKAKGLPSLPGAGVRTPAMESQMLQTQTGQQGLRPEGR